MHELPGVAQRFLRYVKIDTTADPESDRVPSSAGQLTLGKMLAEELRALGAADVEHDACGYVYATLPGTEGNGMPVVALLAHLDTSPDAPGAGVRPVIHHNYDGGPLRLQDEPLIELDPADHPELLDHIGHDVITSDGSTLLGSDDKAGVAVIMQLAEDCLRQRLPHPTIRICFTVDEEIGRGVDHLRLDALGADVAYTIDGSGRDTIYAETFHAADATVRITGRSVHPGYAHGKMINALRIGAELIASLPSDEAPETTSGREGYFHPHHMHGGSVDRADVHILLRDFEEAGIERRKQFLRETCDALRSKYRGASIEVEIVDRYKNMRAYIEDRDPRARTFAHEAARQMGIRLDEKPVRGGTDGARLSELGLPTPNIFNGGHDYHSVREWNTVQNLEHALSFLKTLMAYWETHGSNRERPS